MSCFSPSWRSGLSDIHSSPGSPEGRSTVFPGTYPKSRVWFGDNTTQGRHNYSTSIRPLFRNYMDRPPILILYRPVHNSSVTAIFTAQRASLHHGRLPTSAPFLNFPIRYPPHTGTLRPRARTSYTQMSCEQGRKEILDSLWREAGGG